MTGEIQVAGVTRFTGAWEMRWLGDHLKFLRHGTNPRSDLPTGGAVRYLHYGDIHTSADPYLDPDTRPMPTLMLEDVYRKMLADYFDEPADKAMYKAEQFEQEVKRRFVNAPGQMKLLIVVDKLLTGFDAPPATYLYIDKKMQDHGLFQAICRVNRLDGEDKEYGYIVDYKDLFRSLEGALKDYTGEAFEGYDREDVEGLLKDRLERGRERLEETREQVKALCEPVEPPRDTEAYLRYFCHDGEGDTARQLAANERKRLTLYRMVAAFLRAYANLANEMIEAGYTEAERLDIKNEVSHYEKVRQEVKLASGDYVDLKMFEPAMRHLLDNYIRADDSKVLSAFDDAIRLTVVSRLGWIRRKRAEFEQQDRQSRREFVSGESHYFEGRRYRLDVVESRGPVGIRLRNNVWMQMRVRPATGRDAREDLLYRWYRDQLRQRIPEMIAKWESRLGVHVADWRIRRMKTRWGSCNAAACRIWLNSELAKKPLPCLEYVIVHEMAHLAEPSHNDRYREILDRVMPSWRLRAEELNRTYLADEVWGELLPVR